MINFGAIVGPPTVGAGLRIHEKYREVFSLLRARLTADRDLPSCCPRAIGAINSSHLRCAKEQDIRSSTGVTWHGREIPKLVIKLCLRRAWLRDSPGLGPKVVGSPAARVSRRVGSGRVADQGQGSMSFSRRVLHMDP
jgi:hypothetical protein